MTYFEDITGTTQAQRDQRNAVREALGGQTITQANLDKAGIGKGSKPAASLSGGSGGGGGSSKGATVPQGKAPTPMPRNMRPGSDMGGVDTYIDEIMGAIAPVPRPRSERPLNIVDGAVQPTPRPRSERPPLSEDITTEDVRELERAMDDGVSLEEIILGGVLGAGATIAARRLWDHMGSANKGTGPDNISDAVPGGTGGKPRPPSGSAPKGTNLFTDSHRTYLDEITDGPMNGSIPYGEYFENDQTMISDGTREGALDLFRANPPAGFKAGLPAPSASEVTARTPRNSNTLDFPRDVSGQGQRMIEGTFESYGYGTDPINGGLLTPEQNQAVVDAARMVNSGMSPAEAAQTLNNAGIDMTDEAVVSAIERVLRTVM